MEYMTFSDENLADMSQMLEGACRNDDSPAIDLFQRISMSDAEVDSMRPTVRGKNRKKKRRE